MKNRRILLLIDTSRIYGRDLIAGISKYSRLHGPWTFYAEIPFFGPADGPSFNFDELDGLIVHIPDPRVINQAVSKGLPAIVRGFQGPVPDVPNFIGDNKAVGKMAAEHFLGQGLKNFGFYGYSGVTWSQDRRDSFSEWIAQAGFATQLYCPPRKKRNQTIQHEIQLLSNWLKQLPKPAGVLACNDDRGMDITHACRFGGIRVPDEVAVIGVDNEKTICELANPPLSSIARSFDHAGYRAAELLDRMMNGVAVTGENVLVVPTKVVLRQSTDILAVDDDVVVEVVRFIRNNAARPICVEDVLNEVIISRRYLDQKFNTALGHSVHEEIARIRTERIAQMLLETDRTISQIAYDLGFTSPDHIGRFFRRHKGINPSDFRRNYK